MLNIPNAMKTVVASGAKRARPHDEFIEEQRRQEEKARKIIHVNVDDHGPDGTHGKLFVLFVIDATSSMRSALVRVRRNTIRMAKSFQRQYNNRLQVKYGVVAYRDPVDQPVADKHEICAFGDLSKFNDFIKKIEADGGGDDPEDVAGALENAYSIVSSVPDGATLYMAHITDQTAHGMDEAERHYSERPRLIAAYRQLFELRTTLNIEMHFLPAFDSGSLARDLEEKYREVVSLAASDADDMSKLWHFCPSEDFNQAFMHSLSESASRSVVKPFHLDFAHVEPHRLSQYVDVEGVARYDHSSVRDLKKAVVFVGTRTSIVTPTPPTCDFQYALTQYAQRPVTYDEFLKGWGIYSRTLAKMHTSALPTDSVVKKGCAITIIGGDGPKPKPIGSGGEQATFAAALTTNVDNTTYDAIKGADITNIHTVLFNLFDDESSRDVVLKLPLGSKPIDYDAKAEMHVALAWFASMFSTLLTNNDIHLPGVEILVPQQLEFGQDTRIKRTGASVFVATPSLESTKVVIEPSLLCVDGPFVKYNDTLGAPGCFLDPDQPNYVKSVITLDLFILAVAIWSGFNMVPTDLQGKHDKDKGMYGMFRLTDVAVSANNIRAFDCSTNFGELAVAQAVTSAYDNAHSFEHYLTFLGAIDFTDDALKHHVERLRLVLAGRP